MKCFLKFICAAAACCILGNIGADAANVERIISVPADSQRKAPIENIFQLDGSDDRFILLDDTEDGFFVLTEKYYTRREFDPDGISPFDPQDENNIGYWLNNDFLTNTSIKRLPQEIIDNLMEHTYLTEGGGPSFEWNKDYEITCKVVLLSQTEWVKYNGKFGYADDESYAYWYLRTTRGVTGNPLVACINPPNTGLTGDGKPDGASGVRPAFYLPHDFFNKVKINISKTGDNVISAIRKHSDILQQTVLYTDSELDELLDSSIAPQIENLFVSGRGIVGEEMKGSYMYISSGSGSESGTVIQWLRGESSEGPWSAIMGANSLVYVPDSDDIGYYITMQVTPANKTDAGKTYTAKALNVPVQDISKPAAENIRLNGVPSASERLEAIYHYYDANNVACSGTVYQWQISDDNENFTDIENADGRYYTVSGNESGKYLRVGVAPMKKSNSVIGEMNYSEAVKISDLPEIKNVIIGGGDISLDITNADNKINISGRLNSIEAEPGSEISGVYEAIGGRSADVAFVWQRSNSENGVFGDIYTSDQASYILSEADMGRWIRLGVYAYNADIKGDTVYSDPIFIDAPVISNTLEDPLETVTFNAHKGMTYQIWLEGTAGNYSYSIAYDAEGEFTAASDQYITYIDDSANMIVGTRVGGVYSGSGAFEAVELAVEEDCRITLHNAQAGSMSGSSSARISVIEK